MAKVVEIPAGLKWKWRDEILIYEMFGQLYVRLWTSLTGKRVKTDPAFAGFRKYSGMLGDASRLSSKVYRQLPVERRVYAFYPVLRSLAYALLRQGMEKEEVYEAVMEAAFCDKEVVAEEVVVEKAFVEESVIALAANTDNDYRRIEQLCMIERVSALGFVDALLEEVFGDEIKEAVDEIRVWDE